MARFYSFFDQLLFFLDALASLDFKFSVSGYLMFFTASASTGLLELIGYYWCENANN